MSAWGSTELFLPQRGFREGTRATPEVPKRCHISIWDLFWQPEKLELSPRPLQPRFPLRAVGPARDSSFLRPQYNFWSGGSPPSHAPLSKVRGGCTLMSSSDRLWEGQGGGVHCSDKTRGADIKMKLLARPELSGLLAHTLIHMP